MGRRRSYIDPYDAMMKRLERNGLAYALASGVALVACFVTWNGFVAQIGLVSGRAWARGKLRA
jgi:hypothetical protein